MTKLLIAASIAVASLVVSSNSFALGDPEMGKAKAATCAGCHGADGNSVVPNFPSLAGQHADYLAHALHEYKSGKRKDPTMMGMAAGLSDDDIDNLAAYYFFQKGKLASTPVN